MESVGLILSGQTIDQELALDFGSQIPILLPYHGQPLYVSQIEKFPARCKKLFLLIPESFILDEYTSNDFVKRGLEPIYCKSNLSLTSAILFALSQIKNFLKGFPSELLIMYGDTLILDFPDILPNSAYVTDKPAYYLWGTLSQNESYSAIFAGGLSSTNVELLYNALLNSNDIVKSLQFLLDEDQLRLVTTDRWLDFGHLGTYYQTRNLEIKSRHFNSIKLIDGVVVKTSDDTVKLSGEINWFRLIPPGFRKYVPALISYTEDSYQISFIPFPTLYELSIFGQLSTEQWKIIFNRICQALSTAKRLSPGEVQGYSIHQSRQLIDTKTWMRFDKIGDSLWDSAFGQFAQQIRKSFRSGISVIIGYLSLSCNYEILGVLHGDMCSTNIFFSHLSESILLIDPRGIDIDGEVLIYGDLTYDIAKLYQSLFLGYDAIISDRFSIRDESNFPKLIIQTHLNYTAILDVFISEILVPFGVPSEYVRAKAILLLVSLIPLHSDFPDRQKAFLLKAYSEISQFVREIS